ncbi:hypothetical protein [Agromyces sp. NPDC058110]|uniref:hypothetical protein n=1 Tax=Agromyces sp. NPDC058110 TaxID=3346345 RepID=UPI0036D850F2
MGFADAALPLLSFLAALVAALAVGSIVLGWLRTPGDDLFTATDPLTVGLGAVAFVSGSAAARWLAAAVLQLAVEGVLVIRDERESGEAGHPSARRIHLGLVSGDPRTAGGIDDERVFADGLMVAVFSPANTGGSTQLRPGAVIDVDRVVPGNVVLQSITRARFDDAAVTYREPKPRIRLRVATVAGLIGLALGLLGLLLPDETSRSVVWSSAIIAALALAVRAVLPRFIPLNAAGVKLRTRSNELHASLGEAGPAAEELLPWAVLFDEASVIDRFAARAEAERRAPDWYHATAPFSAERLASCLAVLVAELSQPIRIAGGFFARADDSRFGLPLMYDTKGFGGGYLAGGEPGAWGSGGGFGSGYDGGGFDGGGGGFDGGGFGGGDGGGGN